MAILANIRKRKFVLIAIIALALFAFVVGGSKIFQKNGKVERSIGEINGQKIDYNAFQDKVAQFTKGGRSSQMKASKQVWDAEVKKTLLNQQFDELGITIGSEQLWNLLTSNPAVQNQAQFKDEAGAFSPVLVKEFLEDLASSNTPQAKKQLKAWTDFETSLAESEKETIYNNLVKAGVVTSEKEAEFNYLKDNELVTFKYVRAQYNTVSDDKVKVTDAEIKSYINAHADEYKADPSRDLEYVKVDEKASLDDENALRADLKKAVNGVYNTITKGTDAGLKDAKNLAVFVNEQSDIPYNSAYTLASKLPAVLKDTLPKLPIGAIYGPYKDGEYFKISKIEAVKTLPDSAKAAHILISYQGATRGNPNRTKEVAKKMADSILALVKADKTKLGKLAKDLSDDKGSAAKDGDLGKFAYNAMVPSFRDFVFEGKKGQVGIAESQFGFHIIRIDDLIGASNAYKLATVAKKNLPSKATSKALFTKAAKIEIEAAKPAAKFADIAKKNGLEVKPINNLKALDETLPELGNRREIVRWLYDTDRKIGDVAKFNVSKGQVIVRATAIRTSKVKPVKDVKAAVSKILMNEKKAKILLPKMKGSDLVAIGKANNVNVTQANAVSRASATIPAAGKEPKVVGKAFSLKVDEQSEPIIGNSGVFVLKLIKKDAAPKLTTFKNQATQKTKTLRQRAATDAFKAVKDAAKIEDNRKSIF